MADYTLRPDLYGPGGGEYTDDMGKVWPDPWGTLAPAQTPAAAPTPAQTLDAPASGAADVQGFLSATGQDQPTPAPGPAPLPPAAGGQSSGLQPGEASAILSAPPPPPQPGLADRKGQAAPPAPQPGIADQQSSKTEVAQTSGSSGLSAADQKQAGAQIGQVAQAQGQAAIGTAQAANTLENSRFARAQTALQGATQELEQIAAKQALNEHIQGETDRRMQAAATWRPDRTELFHGDNGTAFGILAGVAAMAGAWMQVRGVSRDNPYLPTIIKMIEDNVADQVRKNSTTIQFLREQKGDLQAAATELKQRQLAVVASKLQNMAIVEDHPAMQQGIAAALQTTQAKNAEWEQDKRQRIMRTVTSNTTKTLVNETKPGKPPISEADAKTAATLREGDQLVADYEEAERNGSLEKVRGLFDSPITHLQSLMGTLPADQRKALNVLERIKVFNVQSLGTRPNQIEAEDAQNIGVPKNDQDIEVGLAHLKNKVQQLREGYGKVAPRPVEEPEESF